MKWFRSARHKAHDCFQQGKTALDRDDADLAISWFNEALRHERGFASGYYGRGFAYLKKAEYDQAIADFSEAIRLRPDNPYCYFFRSLCYSGKGNYTQEQADYDKAKRLDANVEDAVGHASRPASKSYHTRD